MNLDISFLPKKSFFEELNWISVHRSELRKQYQGQWIAVANKKVVAFGRNMQSVEEKAVDATRRTLDEFPVVYMEDPHCVY
ncbi:MAG: DUF5678 domain-containing protein [bacterium]|nr:DUF5678 domain-containing protein [bacterium]